MIAQLLLSIAFQKLCFFILPSQGSKSGRERKHNCSSRYNAREATAQELTKKRSLQRSILKRSSVGAHVEERARRVASYGPPAFQIDGIVKILKDASPGAHPRARSVETI